MKNPRSIGEITIAAEDAANAAFNNWVATGLDTPNPFAGTIAEQLFSSKLEQLKDNYINCDLIEDMLRDAEADEAQQAAERGLRFY
jgi:hypothetical protein